MASDHDCPAAEGRLSAALERLARTVSDLPPDRQAAFRGWLEDEGTRMDTTTPSEQLKAVIRERGLTAYRLGKQCGASIDSIQRFLNGETRLRVDTFDALCATLGLALVEQKRPRGRRTKKGGEHDRAANGRAAGAGGSAQDRADAGGEGPGEREPGHLLHHHE